MWSSFTQLIRTNRDRCVIVEDGEPKYVVLSFDEYQQLQKNSGHSIVASPKAHAPVGGQAGLPDGQGDTAERANHELQEIWDKKATAISIEDLPF